MAGLVSQNLESKSARSVFVIVDSLSLSLSRPILPKWRVVGRPHSCSQIPSTHSASEITLSYSHTIHILYPGHVSLQSSGLDRESYNKRCKNISDICFHLRKESSMISFGLNACICVYIYSSKSYTVTYRR